MYQSFRMRVAHCPWGKLPWFALGLTLATSFGHLRTACCEEPSSISAAGISAAGISAAGISEAGDRPFWVPSKGEPATASDANTPARLTPEEPAAPRPASPRPLTCCNPNIPRPGQRVHPTLAALAEAVRLRHPPGSTSSAPVSVEPVGEETAAAAPSAETPSTETPPAEVPSTEMQSVETPSVDLPPVAAPEAEAPPPEILSPETPPVAAPAAVAPEVLAPSGPLPFITTPAAYAPPPARQALGEANFAPTRELEPSRSPFAQDASPWAERSPDETAPAERNRPQPRGGAEPRSSGFGAPQAAPAGLREPPAIPKSVPAKVIENPYAAQRVPAADRSPSAAPPVRLVRYGEPETRQPQELPPAAEPVQMTEAAPAAARALAAPQSPFRDQARAELAPRMVEPAAAATIRAAGVVDSQATEADLAANPLRWAAKRAMPRPAQWSSGNPLR